MSTDTTSSRSGGIGFFSALTLLFIGLRLGNVIDWSWWWVLAPVWIPLALALLLFAFIAVISYFTEGKESGR